MTTGPPPAIHGGGSVGGAGRAVERGSSTPNDRESLAIGRDVVHRIYRMLICGVEQHSLGAEYRWLAASRSVDGHRDERVAPLPDPFEMTLMAESLAK